MINIQLLLSFLGASVFLAGCDSDDKNGSQSFDTGVGAIDSFLASVVQGDSDKVAAQLGTVETLTGKPAKFTDAGSYLARVKDCSIAKTQKENIGRDVVIAHWSCPDGNYKQVIDGAYAPPKITITELF